MVCPRSDSSQGLVSLGRAGGGRQGQGLPVTLLEQSERDSSPSTSQLPEPCEGQGPTLR
jgi:hypothetical protein